MTWLDGIKSEIIRNRERKLEQENQLHDTDSLLSHLEAVYRHYSSESDIQDIEQDESIRKYIGLSHSQAVLSAGYDNKGRVVTKEIKRIFEKKVQTPTNASSALFSVINRLVKQGKLVPDKKKRGVYDLTQKAIYEIEDGHAVVQPAHKNKVYQFNCTDYLNGEHEVRKEVQVD